MTVLARQEEAAAKARAEADETRRSLEEAAANRLGLEETAECLIGTKNDRDSLIYVHDCLMCAEI